MTPQQQWHKKINQINQVIAKEDSLKSALETARTLGAFQLQGVIFYQNRLCHISQVKTTKENHI